MAVVNVITGGMSARFALMPNIITKRFDPSFNLIKWYELIYPCEWLGCSKKAELLAHDRRNKVVDYRLCGKHAYMMQEEFDWITLWHLSYREKGD